MSTIVTRAGKGSALTHNEVDANFTNLNTDKLQSGDTAASLTITSADINGGTIDGTAIGNSSASSGAFTTLSSTGNTTLGDSSADTVTINGTVQPGVVVSGSSSGDALRITQTGAGNALVVEDSANPDSSPFVVDTSGNVGVGTTTPDTSLNIVANNTGLTSTTANNTLRFTDTDTSTALNQPIGKVEFYTSDTSTGGTGVSAYILSAAAGTSGGGDLRFGTSANASSGSPTENMRITSAGNLQFNSGYGSLATAYGCRAWVNFDGTTNVGGFCTIRASGNVSSVADNGTGNYTINFTTAMPDANYSVSYSSYSATGTTGTILRSDSAAAAGSFNAKTRLGSSSTLEDSTYVNVAIFR